MVTQHGIQLATFIISSSYGDLSSKVCECLLRRGTLTLANIVRFTELTRENVANCLRVLVHQNCVQAFDIQQGGGYDVAPRIVTQYMALFDNIIHKLRTPKFMQVVSDELDNDCLDIFQALIQHGRLSFNQIIDRSKQTAGTSDVDVRESFNKLLSFRFIERCPAPEPFLPPPSEDEQPAKKRGAKSKNAEVPKTTEQRALLAAAPMESMRFLMEMDDLSDERIGETPISTTPGVKRKRDSLAPDEDTSGVNEKKEVMWRVNFEELLRRLRHKACILYVKTRINDEAAIVLSAVLDKSSETKQKADKTAYVTINAIYDEVIKKDGGVSMDFDRIRISLEQLGCESIESGLDESYSIDLKGIIEMAQNEEVESVIMKKYGRDAYRIFRLLSKAGRVLETDKISDTAFVEKNDTLKILFKLWKENYVHMEKALVNIAGGKQVMFLLWRINKEPLRVKILDDMYHAVLNLKLRIAHEQKQGKEILQYPSEKLVGELRKVRVILESSLMNLDEAIMLFHDF